MSLADSSGNSWALLHWVDGVLEGHLSVLVLARCRMYALLGVVCRVVTGFLFLVDVVGGVCVEPCSCWGHVLSVWGLKLVVEVVGCTAAALAYLSCISCMCLDRFLLRVLLPNKCWLSGSIACSDSSVGVHCCSMYDWGCNCGRANKHVSSIP